MALKRSDKDLVDQFYDHGLYVPTRTIDLLEEEINEQHVEQFERFTTGNS